MKIYPKKSKKPLKAIRLFCCECMGASRRKEKLTIPHMDIEGCTDWDCPLYDFRFAKNPFLKRSEKQAKASLANILNIPRLPVSKG